jgi:hypothetical protein
MLFGAAPLDAQADSGYSLAQPVVRVRTASSTGPLRGVLQRTTPDSLYLRADSAVISIARTHVLQLEQRIGVLSSSEIRARRAMRVFRVGSILTGAAVGITALQCRWATSDDFCMVTPILFGAAGIAGSTVASVLAFLLFAEPRELWRPEDPSTWRTAAIPAQSRGSPPIRPLVTLRLTF